MSIPPPNWFAVRRVSLGPFDPRHPDRVRAKQTTYLLINNPDKRRTGNWTQMFTHLVIRPEVEVSGEVFLEHPSVIKAEEEIAAYPKAGREGCGIFLDYFLLAPVQSMASLPHEREPDPVREDREHQRVRDSFDKAFPTSPEEMRAVREEGEALLKQVRKDRSSREALEDQHDAQA